MKATDMRDVALNKLKEIDKELDRADKVLRPERQKIIKVINSLGINEPKPKKVTRIKENATVADLSEQDRNIAIQMCQYIESNANVTARDLMKHCQISADNDHIVYTIVKWLCSSGYCARNTNNEIIPGPEWNKRPI